MIRCVVNLHRTLQTICEKKLNKKLHSNYEMFKFYLEFCLSKFIFKYKARLRSWSSGLELYLMPSEYLTLRFQRLIYSFSSGFFRSLAMKPSGILWVLGLGAFFRLVTYLLPMVGRWIIVGNIVWKKRKALI